MIIYFVSWYSGLIQLLGVPLIINTLFGASCLSRALWFPGAREPHSCAALALATRRSERSEGGAKRKKGRGGRRMRRWITLYGRCWDGGRKESSAHFWTSGELGEPGHVKCGAPQRERPADGRAPNEKEARRCSCPAVPAANACASKPIKNLCTSRMTCFLETTMSTNCTTNFTKNLLDSNKINFKKQELFDIDWVYIEVIKDICSRLSVISNKTLEFFILIQNNFQFGRFWRKSKIIEDSGPQAETAFRSYANFRDHYKNFSIKKIDSRTLKW